MQVVYVGLPEAIGIAVALSMDSFTVAWGVSVDQGTVHSVPAVRLSLSFGFVQGSILILGWLSGNGVARIVFSYGYWMAFIILITLGFWMIGSKSKTERNFKADPTSGITLILLSFATSVDAFAVGFSFALIAVPILVLGLIVGLVTVILTLTGVLAGVQTRHVLPPGVEILGGTIVILVAVWILLSHIF
jgi:putative Mn2+ efflux pump MntP